MAASGAGAAARRLASQALLTSLLLLAPSSSLALTRANRTEEPAAAAAAAAGGRRSCTYTLKVKTSCASPQRTSDAVSVAFGDAYRSEAGAPRLPSGNAGKVFERCATDTFRVAGPCGYGVCYLYLRRSGRDGWAPEWVQVVAPGPTPATATFYFGDPLPDGVWYGHNRCPKAAAATAATNDSSASPQG